MIFSQTLQFLQQNAKERSESLANTTSTTTTSYTLPQTSTKMSMQELDELRKKLGNVTASSNAPLVSISYSDEADLTVRLARETVVISRGMKETDRYQTKAKT